MIYHYSFQINAFSIIGGNHGTAKGKATKVLKQLFEQLMKPTLLSTFTWSGRAKGNLRKNSFEKYKNIQKLIYSVLNLVDKSYSMYECLDDMKKKIFKYAYLKQEKENVMFVENTESIDSGNLNGMIFIEV